MESYCCQCQVSKRPCVNKTLKKLGCYFRSIWPNLQEWWPKIKIKYIFRLHNVPIIRSSFDVDKSPITKISRNIRNNFYLNNLKVKIDRKRAHIIADRFSFPILVAYLLRLQHSYQLELNFLISRVGLNQIRSWINYVYPAIYQRLTVISYHNINIWVHDNDKFLLANFTISKSVSNPAKAILNLNQFRNTIM